MATTADAKKPAAAAEPGDEDFDPHGGSSRHPTTYLETMMHLLKGLIGCGVLAMGDAFKNGGLVLGTILTLFIGLMCLYNEQVLVKVARILDQKLQLKRSPDFARAAELCFVHGWPRLRGCATAMRYIVNIFIGLTQFGFCCVYFVFTSETIREVFEQYHINIPKNRYVPMLIVLPVILVPCLIVYLKWLAPFSLVANACMFLGILVVFYYAFAGLPGVQMHERRLFGTWDTLPLYFGTAMFAFEGIALVLPLKNAMRNPDRFDAPFGVLNVGICIVTVLYTVFGLFGYLRWGEEVKGSLTLNLPQEHTLAQVMKIAVALGMCFTFAVQFFVPIAIMLPTLQTSKRQNKKCDCLPPLVLELLFRVFMVMICFTIALLVPHLNLIISLIGAFASTGLALFFPVVMELVLAYGEGMSGLTKWRWVRNVFSIVFALFGLITGTIDSIYALVHVMSK